MADLAGTLAALLWAAEAALAGRRPEEREADLLSRVGRAWDHRALAERAAPVLLADHASQAVRRIPARRASGEGQDTPVRAPFPVFATPLPRRAMGQASSP